MIQIITNEEQLENVVGGIKAKHVVGITFGLLTGAALIAVGKFSYDVYQEYQTKTNASQDVHGAVKAIGSWASDLADATNIKRKSTYRRLVANVANQIIDIKYDT